MWHPRPSLSLSTPQSRIPVVSSNAVPPVLPNELPVRRIRLWCHSPALERYLCGRMYRDNYDLAAAFAGLKLLMIIAVGVYDRGMAVIQMSSCCLPNIAVRIWLHGRSDHVGSQRFGGAFMPASFLFQACMMLLYTQDLPPCRLISSISSALGSQTVQLCGVGFRAAVPTYPTWVPFALAIQTLLSGLLLSMSVPATSPLTIARRLVVMGCHCAVDVIINRSMQGHLQQSIVPLCASASALILSHVLEHAQRTNLLTLLRLSEQLRERSHPAHAEQRALIRHVFTGSSLPRLVLQARVLRHGAPRLLAHALNRAHELVARVVAVHRQA